MTTTSEGMSKNMLNSFRNGPVKVMGTQPTSGVSSLQKGRIVAQSTRPTSTNTSGTHQPGRPSSAPTKRPASPGGSGTANTSASNNQVTSVGANGQQRVKYNKNTSQNNGPHTRSGSARQIATNGIMNNGAGTSNGRGGFSSGNKD